MGGALEQYLAQFGASLRLEVDEMSRNKEREPSLAAPHPLRTTTASSHDTSRIARNNDARITSRLDRAQILFSIFFRLFCPFFFLLSSLSFSSVSIKHVTCV